MLLAGASGCLSVAFLNRGVGPDERLPGGWTASAPLAPATSRFDAWEPYLWLGAGCALLLVALVLAVAGPSGRSRRAASTG